MDKSTNGGTRPGGAERPQESGAVAPGRGGRMSRPRKMVAVLRLLRGEDLRGGRGNSDRSIGGKLNRPGFVGNCNQTTAAGR